MANLKEISTSEKVLYELKRMQKELELLIGVVAASVTVKDNRQSSDNVDRDLKKLQTEIKAKKRAGRF